jgi:hypothetical protein
MIEGLVHDNRRGPPSPRLQPTVRIRSTQPDLAQITLEYVLQFFKSDVLPITRPRYGMPDATMEVSDRNAIVAATVLPQPWHEGAAYCLATKTRGDVALIRIVEFDDDYVSTNISLNLAHHEGDAWCPRNLTLFRDYENGLWLVPETSGPSMLICEDGFGLELLPPFDTMAQRRAGVLRAAAELRELVGPIEGEYA